MSQHDPLFPSGVHDESRPCAIDAGVLQSRWNVFCRPTNHHRQLTFVVHLPRGNVRNHDWIARIVKGISGLDKQHRVLRNFGSRLFRMLTIVEANTQNRRWYNWGQQLFNRNNPISDLIGFKNISFNEMA